MDDKTGEILKPSVRSRMVKMDLYDPKAKWVYQVKVGYRGISDSILEQADDDCGLLKKGHVNGVTWVSSPNSVGDAGFSKQLQYELSRFRGIRWRVIG